MNYLLLFVGFVILIFGGHWLLKAAVGLSLRLKIPKIVIGMTVVSFATSAPELIVSLNSALEGHADLALGNVIGSNIANLGLVLGIVTIISSISVQKSFYTTNWPVMMLSSIMLYFFIAFDGILQRYEGVILIVTLFVFLVYLLKFQKPAVVDEMPEDDEELPIHLIVIYHLIGGVGLWVGSELLIKGAVNLALEFGVTERVIGVTIISIGTSVPELAASVIAIIKKEKAISLGNLIGSNIFNIASVLGLTAMIMPINVIDKGLLSNDIIWMIAISTLLLPLIFIPKKLEISRFKGLVLFLAYLIFIYLSFNASQI